MGGISQKQKGVEVRKEILPGIETPVLYSGRKGWIVAAFVLLVLHAAAFSIDYSVGAKEVLSTTEQEVFVNGESNWSEIFQGIGTDYIRVIEGSIENHRECGAVARRVGEVGSGGIMVYNEYLGNGTDFGKTVPKFRGKRCKREVNGGAFSVMEHRVVYNKEEQDFNEEQGDKLVTLSSIREPEEVYTFGYEGRRMHVVNVYCTVSWRRWRERRE